MSDVVVIVLAAGASSRMGSPKQLLDFDGQPLVRRAAENALESTASSVIVVIGCESASVGAALAGLDVQVVMNPNWIEGLGTSIQAGLAVADVCGADAVLLMLADQPLITAPMLNALIDKQAETGAAIVASRYAGTVGIPALFARPVWDGLRTLRPDQGCKALILAASDSVLVDCPEAAADIDTPDDLARIRPTPK